MRRLHFDYETYNESDLSEVGLSRYVRDPSLEVTLLAYSLDDGEHIKQQDFLRDRDCLPLEFVEALQDDRVLKIAWNAPFEQNVTKHAFGIEIPSSSMLDPMIIARSLSLPGKLAEVGPILNMPERLWKHEGGKALINYFCKPRKPTAKRPELRNLPHHAPDKWETFRAYNRQDVAAEIHAYYRMKPWTLSDYEWRAWEIDRAINEGGIPVNLAAVENACRLVRELTASRMDELRDITGLENPNSTQQLLEWLQGRAYPFNDMKVGHIRRALDAARLTPNYDPEYLRALELRADIAQTAVKKYAAYEDMTCDDGRLRNVIAFNGAGRTCRFASYGVQAHNMKRPHPDFEKASAQERLARLIETSPTARFRRSYWDPIVALASGVRGAIQAPPGKVFVSADFNAIENRILGWMAGEQKILDVFREERCPYIDFATYVYRESYEELFAEYKAGKKKKRQDSKPAVLGCFGPNTPVLTDRGWVRIVDVRASDQVHDGRSFVRHGGVAFRGRQNVLCSAGLYVTPDHKIETRDGWRPFCQLESRPNEFRKALDSANGRLFDSLGAQGSLAHYTIAGVLVERGERSDERTSSSEKRAAVTPARKRTDEAISGSVWALDSSIFSRIVSTLHEAGARTPRTPLIRITEGVEFVCGSGALTSGLNTLSTDWVRTESSKLTGETTTGTTNEETFGSRHDPNKILTSDTWDIVNAGANKCFVVLTEDGPLVAHNCGYMLGAGEEYEDPSTGEILATGLLGYAWGMGVRLTKEQAAESVQIWRDTFTKVSDYEDGLWYRLYGAMRRCVESGKRTGAYMFEFEKDGPFVTMRLPSSRRIFYIRPRMEDRKTPWGKIRPTITYEGVDSRSGSKKWARISTHPGKVTENADQAIGRDLLVDKIVESWDEGLDVCFHVHDEIIALADERDAERQAKLLSEIMSESVRWAPGLPLFAKSEISRIWVKT